MRYIAIFILIICSVSSYGQSIDERKALYPQALEAAKNGNNEAEYLIDMNIFKAKLSIKTLMRELRGLLVRVTTVMIRPPKR